MVDVDDDRAQRSRFWPKTFAERGVCVPFTTPILSFSRVRLSRLDDGDDESLEILIPGLSGGRGVYVIPWKGVPDTFTLSLHDLELHEEMMVVPAITPWDIRRASLRVARTGLAGLAAVEAAQKAEAEENQEQLLAHMFLLRASIQQLVPKAPDISMAEMATDAGKRKTRTYLRQAAELTGDTADQLYARLEKWSTVIASVGLPNERFTPRVRRLATEVSDFANAIGAWSREDLSDSQPIALLASQMARETHTYVKVVLGEIDAYLGDIGGTLNDWIISSRQIKAGVIKVSWLMDGWENILAIWRECRSMALWEQQQAVLEIGRLLPLIPEEEVEEQARRLWGGSLQQYEKMVKPMESWFTGELDIEIRLRVERYKSASM